MNSKKDQIENSFTYHAPKPGQAERYVQIREKGKELALLIDEFRQLIVHVTPVSREQATALNMLATVEQTNETVVFWSNASIARNE